MKIKQIGAYNGDIIQTVLRNRNISDIELYLNPKNNTNLLNPFNFANMKFAAEILLAHISVNSHIGLLVDPDADGFCSASIIYQYIKKIKPEINITLFFHDFKTHGLTDKIMEKICNTDIELLIIPDAASNNNREIKKLHYMEIDLIIIDHHEIDKYPEFGILVNNQACNNTQTNTNLVGAGMVLKFCEALDKVLGFNYAEEFYDLAALGQISDESDISEPEVRYIVFKGLNSIHNPFLKTALKDSFDEFQVDVGLAPRDLSFSIIPLINSVVRVGKMEEKELLFRALNSIDANQTFNVIKKKKNKETGKFDNINVTQDLYEYTLDIIKKVKNRQQTLVKKTVADLNDNIDNSGGIAIGILEVSSEGSVTGLVANKFAGKLQKPVILVQNKDGRYVGSGRGYEKTLPSLRDWCNETGLVDFAQGHANAFGVAISEENFEAFKEKTREMQPQDFVYEVDAIIDRNPNPQIIADISANKHLFGGRVQEPLLAFTNIEVWKSDIKKGNGVITFTVGKVEFILFDAPEGLYESLTTNFKRALNMNFVGTANVNKFLGRTTYQIVITDFEENEFAAVPEPEEITVENIVF